MKTLDNYFADWESEVFGFGYGTGERHVLPQLKAFLELCNDSEYNNRYDFRTLEKNLTPAVAWLLINALCKTDIIEYGTSPRHGWLTDKGMLLKSYVQCRTVEQLLSATCYDRTTYSPCSERYCNCGAKQVAQKCINNPFW
jgi:hypothetical protein